MTTTNNEDQRCNRSIRKYPDAYLHGRNAFAEGIPNSENPYLTGTKLGSDRRVAWFSGWLDAWREGREKHYDSLRRTDEERHNNSNTCQR